MDLYECWRCGLKFESFKESFDHKENDCTEVEWSDFAEHY